MSKLSKKLNDYGIHNEYGITQKGHPMVRYRAQQTGRGAQCPGWLLGVKGERFKDAHWRDNGCLFFLVWGKHDREEKRLEAFAQLEALFPGMVMTKSPFSRFSYVPKEDLEKIIKKMEEVKE